MNTFIVPGKPFGASGPAGYLFPAFDPVFRSEEAFGKPGIIQRRMSGTEIVLV